MISDKLIFYAYSDSIDSFCFKCPVCSKRGHGIEKCPLISYLPDRDFLIKKLNLSTPQPRNKRVKFMRSHRINALKNLRLIQRNAAKVDFNEENDSGVSSDENELMIAEKLRNREKRKKMTTYVNTVPSQKNFLNIEEEYDKEKEKEKEKVIFRITKP